MKASIEPTGWGRRNGWNSHCKHSVLISKTHFGENPKPPGAESCTADLGQMQKIRYKRGWLP